MSLKTVGCCLECIIMFNEVKFKNLLPWAKNTGCESQWFGGDRGRSDLFPWSASSTPSTHTTGVMQPGTNTLWARHTQGALFLEVRKGAKNSKACKVRFNRAKWTEKKKKKPKPKKQSACTFLCSTSKTIKQRVGKNFIKILGSYQFHSINYLLIHHFHHISGRLLIKWHERKKSGHQ